MSRVPWARLLPCALLWPASSAAAPGPEDSSGLSLSVVETFTAEARMDNGNGRGGDDGFGVFINRTNLQANTSELSLGARVDGVLFADTPTTAYAGDLRVERISAELRLGEATLVAGDFYRQLGRGILLSLRKVDEVGLDLALRGAEARYAPEGHALSLFAGVVNPANLDLVSLFPVEDSGDLLAGGSYELSAVEGLSASLFGLYAQPAERLLDTLDYTVSGGAALELIEVVEGLTLYAEGALQDRRLAGGTELGTALYLTADLLIGEASFLLEGLRLTDFEQKGSRNTALGTRFDLNVPPTLERIDQEVLNSRDVTGARLKVEYAWLDGALITYANGLVRVNEAGEPSELLQLHAYAGGELRYDERRSKLGLSGGLRSERMGERQLKSLLHGELELTHALGGEWALHLSSTNEIRTLEERRYARGSSFLGAEWAGTGSLSFELGYDTQNPSPEVRRLFFAGILALDLGEHLRVRTTAGTQRGGLKCVAGVCREFPTFAGARAEIVVRL